MCSGVTTPHMSLLRIMSHVALAMLDLPGLPIHKASGPPPALAGNSCADAVAGLGSCCTCDDPKHHSVHRWQPLSSARVP